jgi:thiol:disulfide interchange protein
MIAFSRRACGLLLPAVLLVLGTTQPIRAQALKSESVVAVKAKAEKPEEGKQVVTVTVTPKKGWYIYANPVGLDDFAENQTVVRVVGREAKVEYPAGKPVADKVVGEYKIYDEPITVKAILRRDKGDTSPLEVTVKVQACTKGRCLTPSTIKVPVE